MINNNARIVRQAVLKLGKWLRSGSEAATNRERATGRWRNLAPLTQNDKRPEAETGERKGGDGTTDLLCCRTFCLLGMKEAECYLRAAYWK